MEGVQHTKKRRQALKKNGFLLNFQGYYSDSMAEKRIEEYSHRKNCQREKLRRL